MKHNTMKLFMAGMAAAMCIVVSPVHANAGTTNATNHPYTQYTYTTSFTSDNANGSYTPSGSVTTKALSHDHTLVWVDDNGTAVVDCTTTTTKHLRCKTCNYAFSHGIASYAAVGHQYNEASWVIDKEPTCTTTGLKHQVCRVCGGGSRNANTVIPATGHTYKTATLAENGGIKSAATCTTNAVYYQKCAGCGAVDQNHYNEVEGTMLNHTFSNGKCTTCGQYADTIWGQIRQALNL